MSGKSVRKPPTRRDQVMQNRARSKREYRQRTRELERVQRAVDRAWASYCKWDDELYKIDNKEGA